MKDDLVAWLKDEAGRNGGQGAYAWRSRDLCGKAAAEILSLQSQLAAAQDKLARAEGALTEAREALHFHYVEWDGEPEDAVPLQLARAKCDKILAALREPAVEEGRE